MGINACVRMYNAISRFFANTDEVDTVRVSKGYLMFHLRKMDSELATN